VFDFEYIEKLFFIDSTLKLNTLVIGAQVERYSPYTAVISGTEIWLYHSEITVHMWPYTLQYDLVYGAVLLCPILRANTVCLRAISDRKQSYSTKLR